jgi:hypothetical protein
VLFDPDHDVVRARSGQCLLVMRRNVSKYRQTEGAPSVCLCKLKNGSQVVTCFKHDLRPPACGSYKLTKRFKILLSLGPSVSGFGQVTMYVGFLCGVLLFGKLRLLLFQGLPKVNVAHVASKF